MGQGTAAGNETEGPPLNPGLFAEAMHMAVNPEEIGDLRVDVQKPHIIA